MSLIRSGFFVRLAGLLLLGGCSLNPQVAQVGRYKITQRDAEYRNKIIRLYSPEETRKLGAEQLIRSYTFAEILNNNGFEITPEKIAQEENRIDQTTQMPELLYKIKSVFQGDRDAYRRVYILPIYAERVIYYEFFLNNKKIHAKSFEYAQSFVRDVNAKKASFEKLLEMYDKKAVRFTVSLFEGLHYPPPPGSPQEEDRNSFQPAKSLEEAKVQMHLKSEQEKQQSEEGRRWINEVIKPLKPGQAYSKVIDHRETWQVVRYVGPVPKKKDTYQMESIFFPKANYGEWLEAEKQKVKIQK